jgi:hypothetical protein
MIDEDLSNNKIKISEQERDLKFKLSIEKKRNDDLQAMLTNKNHDLKIKRDEHDEKFKKVEEVSDDFQHLEKDCKDIVNKFLNDSETFKFHVEYNKNISTWTIDDDSMTFLGLKQKTKGLIGRRDDDFVFSDKDDKIFLDNLKVKGVLFPFSKVNLKDAYPVVKVLEVCIEDSKQIEKIKGKSDAVDLSKISKTENLAKIIIEILKKKYYSMLQLLFFFIFLYLFTMNTVFFRNSEDFSEIIQTFNSFKLIGFKSDVYN